MLVWHVASVIGFGTIAQVAMNKPVTSGWIHSTYSMHITYLSK